MPIFSRQITRDTLKLALPVMLTQLGQATVQIFDNIIVGKLLGSDALASVSLANSIFFSLFVFGMGISLAIPPLVSEASAKNETGRIQAVFQHGLYLNLGIGLLLMMVLSAFIPAIPYLHQPVQILPNTTSYLGIMIMTLLPVMAFQTLRETSEGLGFTVGVTIATVIGNVVNIAFNYIFIKGLFGITPMGVAGSGYATLLARIVMLVCMLIIMARNEKTGQYIRNFSFKISHLQREIFRKMLTLGLPTALQLFFEVTAFAGAAFICGLVSATDISGHQIALSMASFTFNLCVGFSVASTVMVGRNFGSQDFTGVKNAGLNNIGLAFVFMAFSGLTFILFREQLPHFFAREEDLATLKLASELLIVAALFQLSDGIQVTALGALRGIQDVKAPSIITFIAYWIFTIPFGYYLCVVRGMGAFGMWIALGVGLTLSAIMLVLRFLKTSNRLQRKNLENEGPVKM